MTIYFMQPYGHGPRFYITARQPIRPAAVMLAMASSACVLLLLAYGLGRTGHGRFHDGGTGSASRSPGSSGSAPGKPDERDDDPDQVDTIVLGDAADAPAPARKGQRVSDVHATILIHLPRFGQEVGLIPDSPAGRLLYQWLAAFNRSNLGALTAALPSSAPESAAAAQMVLRLRTGGFALISAREVQPGLLVFRLHDETPAFAEVLGTLQVQPGSNPPTIGSLSLRAVPPDAAPVPAPQAGNAR